MWTTSVAETSGVVVFLVTGGIAAAVNVASRWLLQFLMPYEAAVTLAYLCGMVTAFVLAKIFVFRGAAGSTHGQFARFAMVNAVAFAQVFLVSEVLARVVFPAIGLSWQPEMLAHVIGVASPVAISYLLHKHFSFRRAVS